MCQRVGETNRALSSALAKEELGELGTLDSALTDPVQQINSMWGGGCCRSHMIH
jgi:hypothetical protein